MHMRTRTEKVIDLLLALKAIKIASQFAKFDGILMLQKVIFLAALQYRDKRFRVLNQSFYRWDWGPMSEEVYDDFNDLSNLGLIEGDIRGEIHVTERGKQLIEASSKAFENKTHLISMVEDIAKNVKSLDDILNEVYSKKVFVEAMGKVVPMREIPEGMHILSPVWKKEAKDTLFLDKSWIETIELMLDPKADAAIRKSLDDAKKGRIRPLELD